MKRSINLVIPCKHLANRGKSEYTDAVEGSYITFSLTEHNWPSSFLFYDFLKDCDEEVIGYLTGDPCDFTEDSFEDLIDRYSCEETDFNSAILSYVRSIARHYDDKPILEKDAIYMCRFVSHGSLLSKIRPPMNPPQDFGILNCGVKAEDGLVFSSTSCLPSSFSQGPSLCPNIEKPTIIRGRRADCLLFDDYLNIISSIEGEINRLQDVDVQSSAIELMVAGLNKDLADIVETFDEHFGK